MPSKLDSLLDRIEQTYHTPMVGAVRVEVGLLRAEVERLRADLATARALLREMFCCVDDWVDLPEGLLARIDAAIAGERREGEG